MFNFKLKVMKTSDVSNYIKFLKLLEFNTREGIPFKTGELITQCEVSKNVILGAKKAGLISSTGAGQKVKYKMLIGKVEPHHARKLMETTKQLHKDWNEAHKERTAKKTVEVTQPVKTEEKPKTDAVVGKIEKRVVKRVKITTRRIGLFAKSRTIEYTYE